MARVPMKAVGWCGIACALALAGCSKEQAEAPEGPALQVVAPSALPAPRTLSSAEVAAVVNPRRLPPYRGSLGSVRGVVRLEGPPAPEAPPVLLSKIPAECAGARQVLGRQFREGPERQAADVLVAVTGYEVYVEPASDVVEVTMRDCAYQARTVAMMLGQRLLVQGRGTHSHMPFLVGPEATALMVAIPNGAPVDLFPPSVGRFILSDQLHLFALAELFVLRYPTFSVTGLDGRYEIKRVPPGKLKLSALLPSVGAVVEHELDMPPGGTLEVDLSLQYRPAEPAGSAVAPAASASNAAPPASGP